MKEHPKTNHKLWSKWITNKNTLEYLGVWEKVNNPDFNYPEFGVIGQEAVNNRFIMFVGQWIDRNAPLPKQITKFTQMLQKIVAILR